MFVNIAYFCSVKINNYKNNNIMRILHTADLHLGQVIYQNYERSDEHQHFFKQLTKWCKEEHPDALLVSGDVFDIQQPSSSTKKAFTDYFVGLHQACPEMKIIITAGNHDSASRIQADSAVWECANTHLVGVSPAVDAQGDWMEQYIVRLEQGYIVPIPFMRGERADVFQTILNKIAEENKDGKPVVMMAHTAVTGLDIEGHSFEIGKLETQDPTSFGRGYDYLALGHIHKPQTIGHPEDVMREDTTYSAPVIRYSGSSLHVSCDEKYPHSVSLVEIDKHGGNVNIHQLRIEQLRHFYELPLDGSSFNTAEEAIEGFREFCKNNKSGYIRLRMDKQIALPSDFNQQVYEVLSPTDDEICYNPKIIWTGEIESANVKIEKPTFEVADLQQMTDPMVFIEKTKNQYPSLDLDELRDLFNNEIKAEIEKMREKAAAKEAEAAKKKKKENKEESDTNNEETL